MPRRSPTWRASRAQTFKSGVHNLRGGKMFQPISPPRSPAAATPARLVRPVALRLPKGGGGVQLSEYKMREFDALLMAGRTGSHKHRAVQSAIQKERGGVLPSNWDVALAVKQNVEAMESAKLQER